MALSIRIEQISCLMGLGGFGGTGTLRPRTARLEKNLYFLLDKTVFMQNMGKACKVAYMDFLRVHMSTPTPGCSWGGRVPQPFSAHLTRQVTIPTLRMR